MNFYLPKWNDLWFRQAMLADAETMAYNHAWGGTIPFPETQWRDWSARWFNESDGKHYYRYLQNECGKWVGEAAYHYDEERGYFLANLLVYAPCRKHGYGKQGLELLCKAAQEHGIDVLYDDIALDNPAIKLFRSAGFTEDSRTEEVILLKKELGCVCP